MNRVLLAKVRDRIAEVGEEHCDMNHWARGNLLGTGELTCGTAGCIAGWTVAVNDGNFGGSGILGHPAHVAKKLLDFPSLHAFYQEHWPQKYRQILRDEGDAKGMLAVCDALLDGTLQFGTDGLTEVES